MRQTKVATETLSNIVQSTPFTAINLLSATGEQFQYCKTYNVHLAATVNTPSAATFTAAVTDICTAVAHGFYTGLKVQLTTTNTLPAGLSLATDYFVIRLTADTFSLATSLVLANAGTAHNITDTGTGDHTITPVALAGGSVKLQGSPDGVAAYVDLGVSSNITTTTDIMFEKVDPSFNFLKVVPTVTAGQMSIVQTVTVKGL